MDSDSLVFYDGPESPATREQWRQSSVIKSIERLRYENSGVTWKQAVQVR